MATIVGGIATSHTPTIGFALDANKQLDPVWAPIFAGYEPVRQWLADQQPDVLFYIYNDHATSFFFDHYSHFALGVGERYWPADEGGGPRKLPPIKGHPGLARHVATGLVADEFDLAFFQAKGLDHGCFSPLSLLWPHERDWPGAIVPLQVGVLQFPIPSARRCFKLGRALRKAIESYPEDLKVAIVGTGGLSHQIHGERAGFNNTAWDLEFLDLLEKDPEKLTDLTIADYAERGGCEGSEVIMWLVMRGALSVKVKKLHQAYYLPSMTPIATVIYENASDEASDESVADYRARIERQWVGLEKLPGTYPFTLDRSVKAFRLNSFLHRLIEPAQRRRFLSEPEPMFTEAGLTDEERNMVRARDWQALIHYGVIFFLLEKLGAVIGTTNLHIYAAMRGQSLEEFQQTRNSQILYSVAGDAGSR
ncbi:MAG: protocatechuate 3,4-dioxygenase [Gammaproteobacteria bacterium]|jgi:gallate dioxygenase|nr:protocatechuate 3,4-dioxygenase [Gammaproteobacteria bacterium]